MRWFVGGHNRRMQPVEPVSRQAPPLRGPVLMNQDWCDLAYLHWAVEPERVAHLMPADVRPDVHEGATYVGLVPFRMVGAGFGSHTSVPWAGTFLETNVRLYSVDEQGRRGVVFVSLDSDRLLVVLAARTTLVPYRWARMGYELSPGEGGARDGLGAVHRYSAELRWPGVRAVSELAVTVGHRREPTPLDDFVSLRWRLHTGRWGRTLLVPNTHQPWVLHDVEVDLDDGPGGILGSVGFADLASRPPDQSAWSPGVHTRFGFPAPA